MFRYLPQISLTAASIIGYTAGLHKHAFGAETHKKELMYYKDEEHPFDPSTNKIIEEMIDYSLLNMPTISVVRMNFYWTKLLDPVHHGTHFSRFGTFIGIPVTFRYGSKSDVDLSCLENYGILLNNENAAAIESLKDALILSENAKRFALASELKAVDTLYVLEKLNVFGCIAGAYYMGAVLSPMTERLPSLVQLGCLITLICVWTCLWYNAESFYTFRRRMYADKTASEIGQEYLQGGLEYFAKLRQRNMALRKLQVDGETLYKENGDRIKPLLEIPTASLSLREKRLIWLKKENFKHGLEDTDSGKVLSSKNLQVNEVKQLSDSNGVKQNIDSLTNSTNVPSSEKMNDPGLWQKIVRIFV